MGNISNHKRIKKRKKPVNGISGDAKVSLEMGGGVAPMSPQTPGESPKTSIKTLLFVFLGLPAGLLLIVAGVYCLVMGATTEREDRAEAAKRLCPEDPFGCVIYLFGGIIFGGIGSYLAYRNYCPTKCSSQNS